MYSKRYLDDKVEDEQPSYATIGHDEGDSKEKEEVSGLLAED